MFVYRIVKSQLRVNDLSGTGAFRFGGRWNSKGTCMLYTSENSSLAYLETLVHLDENECPPSLFIVKIEMDASAPIHVLKELEYPASWKMVGSLENKFLGDKWMSENKFLGIKVRSAINDSEHNYLLNPLFPVFHRFVKVVDVTEIIIDERLIG